MLTVPAELEWLREEEPGGAEWLERLPRLAAECAEAWRLDLGEPLPGAFISLVVPAGGQAILKINFPSEESEHEGDALLHWAGHGAIRLLAEDRPRRALLIERCRPGTRLWDLPDGDRADHITAEVLRSLHERPVGRGHEFRLLADEAAGWAEEIPARWEQRGRPFPRALVSETVAFLREPPPDERFVLHQDLHGGNILSSERGWLAIDPKPLVGERAFDAASFLRDRRDELARDPAPKRRIRRRLDVLENELGLDRERMRGWGIAHALAWGMWDTDMDPGHFACAAALADIR